MAKLARWPKGQPRNKRTMAEEAAAYAAPPRCVTLRCSNLAAVCCNGRCWTCSAREYERNRQTGRF